MKELDLSEMESVSGGKNYSKCAKLAARTRGGPVVKAAVGVACGVAVGTGIDKAASGVYNRATSEKKNYTNSEWDAVRGVGPSAHSDAIRGPR